MPVKLNLLVHRVMRERKMTKKSIKSNLREREELRKSRVTRERESLSDFFKHYGSWIE